MRPSVETLLVQVATGERLKDIGARYKVSKQAIQQRASKHPQYLAAHLQAIERRAVDMAHGRYSLKLSRYLRRSLIPMPGIRRAAQGLFRGPCHACSSPRGVYARTSPTGGVAECIDCGWQGRADVYVLGRESQALHIVHKQRDRVT